jgi:CTP synthase (UTP-ammonia lyase)
MKLAIIGDYNDNFIPHRATKLAIGHSLHSLDLQLPYEWIATDTIEANLNYIVSEYNGFWIALGSPYKCMSGALEVIKFARLNNIPTLGTCGGFQHMVIEFARNVLNITDAEHAEYDPYASKLVINPLSCVLQGQKLEIELSEANSKTFGFYDTNNIFEKYYCNFGLNPQYQKELDEMGFKIVGMDKLKEARILELEGHPFFIATLFVPQDNSTIDKPHPLVTNFLKTILDNYIPQS